MGKTEYLPGFTHHLCGRPSEGQKRSLRERATKLDGLCALVARFIPAECFSPAAGTRKRVYTPWVTFVAFLGQVLTRGSTCREAVRRVQAWCVAEGRPAPDESTSAYCQSRDRLSLEALREVHQHVGEWIERHAQESWKWCNRSVRGERSKGDND